LDLVAPGSFLITISAIMRKLKLLFAFWSVVVVGWLFVPFWAESAEFTPGTGAYSPRVLPASDEGELAIRRFQYPKGFQVELFAAEPMLANPVAFAIDEKGRFYVAETFRHSDGVLDIRGRMHWLDEELASTSTEDWRRIVLKYLSPEVPRLTRESERVRLIEDTTGDGKADRATVFAEGFNDLLDGIGSGVLARKGDVYFSCVPHLWLLRDTTGNGQADFKESLQYGYGLRFAFIGHDLHGLRIGPDRKLYFTMGDRGLNVKQGDRTIASHESGAVLRCNLDGSDLEIFAVGLRNPQELAFDEYGNLFTGENNSDGGDLARWVYLVEGGDSGWQLGWQFINAPTSRGPWIAERMDRPQNELHPAYIIPPIANIGNGPSGLTYYPGIGLPERYKGHFFLADFKGSPGQSLIHTFSLKPKGASFEMVNRTDFVSGVLVTDVDFGPDGGLYFSDWVEGWSKPGKGRIYRLTDPELYQSDLVRQTKKLIADGFEKRSPAELAKLLAHPHQTVRQEAQFALVDLARAKNRRALNLLTQTARAHQNQLARVHAIWGLGELSAQFPDRLATLIPLLKDRDAEIRAQAAKVLGDARHKNAFNGLAALLKEQDHPRGQFFAAMALGKLGRKEAAEPLMQMLRANADNDPYLRHAGVMGLLWLNDPEILRRAGRDASPSVRLAAVVALRRLASPELAAFLQDEHPAVVLEAARAINDAPVPEAMPALARLIERPVASVPLLRRVINANYRLGTEETARAMARFATLAGMPEAVRLEALQLLEQWAKPSGRDQVVGLWRRLPERDPNAAAQALRPLMEDLLRDGQVPIRVQAARLAGHYGIREVAPLLRRIAAEKQLAPNLRVEALRALANQSDPQLAQAVELASADPSEVLRKEATALQARLPAMTAIARLNQVLESGSVGEQQAAFAGLANLKNPEADAILSNWLSRLLSGTVRPELQLDLIEAAAGRRSPALDEKLIQFEASRPKDDLGPYRETLAGGNAELGRAIFFDKAETSCARCHRAGDAGGDSGAEGFAGPSLTGIGAQRSREYLLEAIVFPNQAIAEGFETVDAFLKNGAYYSGLVESEDETHLVLNSPEDGPVRLAKAEIERRERGLSGMPEGMGALLTRRELRDLIEFLASLK
jgi:quinoprotein glucose dehydrogenase